MTRPALCYSGGSRVLSRGGDVSRGSVCIAHPPSTRPAHSTISDLPPVKSVRDYSVDRPSQEEERRVCTRTSALPGAQTPTWTVSQPPPQTLQTCMYTPHTHTPTRGISHALQLVMIGFGAKPHTQHRRQGPFQCSPPLMMVFTGLFFFNFVGGLEMKSLRDTSKRSSRAPTCTCFKTAAGAL